MGQNDLLVKRGQIKRTSSSQIQNAEISKYYNLRLAKQFSSNFSSVLCPEFLSPNPLQCIRSFTHFCCLPQFRDLSRFDRHGKRKKGDILQALFVQVYDCLCSSVSALSSWIVMTAFYVFCSVLSTLSSSYRGPYTTRSKQENMTRTLRGIFFYLSVMSKMFHRSLSFHTASSLSSSLSSAPSVVDVHNLHRNEKSPRLSNVDLLCRFSEKNAPRRHGKVN